MEIIKSALRVSNEYHLSAFAVALLMVIFYGIVTNGKLIAVADRVLNKSLEATNLYKFIKLGIISVFAFSMTVVILAFVSPMITKEIDNRTLKILQEGRNDFDHKDFSGARSKFKKYSALTSADDPNEDEVAGLITATFYAEKLHEEGLEFICENYRLRTKDDMRHMFAAHAHIRAIAISLGGKKAEEVAGRFRSQCKRIDFSKYWAHIPFGMMESLRTGRLRTEHGWEIEAESKARLKELLLDEQRRAATANVPLADYVLYFLDDFDYIIDNFKESRIRDSALFDAAKFSKGQKRIGYLVRLIEEYPRYPRIDDALAMVANELAISGDRVKALFYASKIISKDKIQSAFRSSVEPSIKRVGVFIRNADLKSAAALAQLICEDLGRQNIGCFEEIRMERGKISKAMDILKNKNSLQENRRCAILQLKIRSLAILDDKKIDNKWIAASRSILIGCIKEPSEVDADDYARSLYLVASLSRQIGDYKTSIEYLNRFAREIREHDLSDDVMTEIGYHRFMIENDWNSAKNIFESVVNNYPDRNSADNALWWYAKGLKGEGNYLYALKIYTMISSSAIESRFKKWMNVEARQLAKMTAMSPFVGLALKSVEDQEPGLQISNLSSEAPAAKLLRQGDRLVRVCGKQINNIDDVLRKVDVLESNEICRVLFLRKSLLIRLDRNMDGRWNSSAIVLSKDQLSDLAFGLGEF
jgi:outer membrane protein assembly factor BamD (BamD/ComL family)